MMNQGMEALAPRKQNQKSFNLFSGSLLIEVKRGNNIFTSSSVAIGARMLLTAAHCVENIDDGKVFLTNTYNTKSKKFINIQNVIIHHDYSQRESNFLNDIAIIILEEDLPNSIETYEIYNGSLLHSSLVRVGFGGRNFINKRNIFSPDYIAAPCDKRFFKCVDYQSEIGDSGGPIFIKINGEYQLVGIHSTLEGAHLTYSVKVEAFIQWIELVKNVFS